MIGQKVLYTLSGEGRSPDRSTAWIDATAKRVRRKFAPLHRLAVNELPLTVKYRPLPSAAGSPVREQLRLAAPCPDCLEPAPDLAPQPPTVQQKRKATVTVIPAILPAIMSVGSGSFRASAGSFPWIRQSS
jgi:hypothetical protein